MFGIEIDEAQLQRVGDDGDGADAHGGSGDDGAEHLRRGSRDARGKQERHGGGDEDTQTREHG